MRSADATINKHKRELELCTYCPKLCRHSCPVSNATGRETHTPQAKMQLLNHLQQGSVEWTRETARPLFACLECKNCTTYCDHGNDVAGALAAGKAAASERGLQPIEYTQAVRDYRLRETRLRNALQRTAAASEMATRGRIAYLPGCDNIEFFPETISDAFSIFRRLDLRFVRMPSGITCGGHPLWAAGAWSAAHVETERLLEHLSGFSTLVMGCAPCTDLWRRRLEEHGISHQLDVIHTSEFFFTHLERLKPRSVRRAALFHDSCSLGRGLGVYDPPRRVASRCVEHLGEFFHHRDRSPCCGADPALDAAMPEVRAKQRTERLGEASRYGIDTVVTTCARCRRSLSRSAAGDQRNTVDLVDLTNLLAEALHTENR
ncbi:MAG: (Fe-S)-binding protein [Deltaproteobacteria bacterium]|nr:(Fe-S)-binding protein [Deltaproteobacteria bacterium]